MDRRTKKNKMKGKNRCQMSGKIIGNRSAVLVENAVDYVRKLGYLVSNIKFMWIIIAIMVLLPGIYGVQSVFRLQNTYQQLDDRFICEMNNISYRDTFLDFDGINDYIDGPLISGKDFNVTENSDFAISLWFKTESGINSGKGAGVIGRKFGYGMHVTDGNKLVMGMRNSSNQLHSQSYIFSNDTWYLAVFSYNGTNNTFIAYFNGTSTGKQFVGTLKMSSGDNRFRVGGLTQLSGSSAYLNGSIDEVRFYNKTLILTEIEEIYNSGREIPNSTLNDSLILWYPMLEGEGIDMFDYSGYENHGE